MQVQLEDMRKEFGDLVAVDDLSMTIKDGEFVSLVGPSGCGKTTTLRCIVGLETPTDGSIKFGDQDVTDLPPKKRDVAMVFQNYALYPHMTARQNMSFALRDAGFSKEETELRIDEMAQMLGIRDQLNQKPGELSGGQKQRVALGRSLVRDPEVFLLDEPLSNLDAKLRTQMRAELQRIHQEYGTTTIYVTHDQEEAMTMSDRIAVLNDGQLQQLSSPDAAYSRPVNRFVAGFIGSPSMNFLPCQYSDGRLVAGPFTLEAPALDNTDKVAEIGIRPENFHITHGNGDVTGTVDVFERVGSLNTIYVDVDEYEEEITVQTPADELFNIGDRIELSITDRRFHVFADDGTRIHSPELDSEEEPASDSVVDRESIDGVGSSG